MYLGKTPCLFLHLALSYPEHSFLFAFRIIWMIRVKRYISLPGAGFINEFLSISRAIQELARLLMPFASFHLCGLFAGGWIERRSILRCDQNNLPCSPGLLKLFVSNSQRSSFIP